MKTVKMARESPIVTTVKSVVRRLLLILRRASRRI
jgi:hypothetical protein